MNQLMKKIAVVSNFDDEMYSERILPIPDMDEKLANEICQLLNKIAPDGPAFYKAVPPDYVHYKVSY